MVAPVTGPFKIVDQSSAAYAEEKIVFRQRKPYTLPLTGSHYRQVRTSGFHPTADARVSMRNLYVGVGPLRSRAVAEALEALQDNDDVALGVALVQYGQARRTVVQRFRQLLDFSLALKYGNIRGMRRALRVNADIYRSRLPDMPGTRALPSRGWRDYAREYGGTWLEWSWGIAPVIQDIEGANAILASDIMHRVDLAKRRDAGGGRIGVRVNYDVQLAYAPPPYFNEVREKGTQYFRLVGEAELKNPNKLIYNQLGLDEPLKIGFEVIPWSFLLSWVSNVETFLDNWSPKRELYQFNRMMELSGKNGVWSVRQYNNGSTLTAAHQVHVSLKTPISTLPRVDFYFKPLSFGVQRAANAVALLSTFFKSVK